DELPGLVVDGMRDILIRPVGTLPARHRHEHPVRALDDLETSDDEGVVERHARERLQLVIVPQGNTDLGDFERHSFTASSSGPRSLEVHGDPLLSPRPHRTPRTKNSGYESPASATPRSVVRTT